MFVYGTYFGIDQRLCETGTFIVEVDSPVQIYVKNRAMSYELVIDTTVNHHICSNICMCNRLESLKIFYTGKVTILHPTGALVRSDYIRRKLINILCMVYNAGYVPKDITPKWTIVRRGDCARKRDNVRNGVGVRGNILI
jgi:hypothetical protein